MHTCRSFQPLFTCQRVAHRLCQHTICSCVFRPETFKSEESAVRAAGRHTFAPRVPLLYCALVPFFAPSPFSSGCENICRAPASGAPRQSGRGEQPSLAGYHPAVRRNEERATPVPPVSSCISIDCNTRPRCLIDCVLSFAPAASPQVGLQTLAVVPRVWSVILSLNTLQDEMHKNGGRERERKITKSLRREGCEAAHAVVVWLTQSVSG